MERCHLYLPLVDSSGSAYAYAEVTLLDEETGTAISDPVYLEPHGGAPQQWPVLIDPAVINLWTDAPRRVTVQALLPGGGTYTRSGVDIGPAPAATVRSSNPVHVGSTEGLEGNAVLAISPDRSAAWQVLDVLRFHEHEGGAPESTVLGSDDLKDIYPSQTWIGRDPSGAQGEGSSVLGAHAYPNGPEAVVLGSGSSGEQAVVVGSNATGPASSVVLGASGTAQQAQQVVLGRNASAAAASQGAVVVGPGVQAAADGTLTVGSAVRVTEDGTVILGQGAPPDLAWLGSDPYIAILGSAVFPHYFAPRQDVVLAGAASTFGAFGAAGAYQPLVSTASITSTTPGREALLSLVSALDALGLIYRTDGAIDDELATWSQSFAHDPNLVLETGDTDGSKAGDTTRAKRNAAGPGWVTYRSTTGIRDFRARVFAYQPGGPSSALLDTEVVAEVSPDNAAWTRIPLSWQPPTATAALWYQSWAANARPVPSGMRYLRLTLQTSTDVYTPQIGRVIVRPVPST